MSYVMSRRYRNRRNRRYHTTEALSLSDILPDRLMRFFTKWWEDKPVTEAESKDQKATETERNCHDTAEIRRRLEDLKLAAAQGKDIRGIRKETAALEKLLDELEVRVYKRKW